MAAISIPDEDVIPLPRVADDLRGLRILFVNVYGVSHTPGTTTWTLVDAGLPFSASYIRSWAKEQFGTPPSAIVLTHGHFDHVSTARELAETWQIPVYAHPLEFPYLTGQKSYPAPHVGAGGGLMSLLSPLYPRGPVDLGDRLRALPADGEPTAALPGWQVIHTPGHTPGHISFFRPSDRLLLAGDAFCTTKPESFFEAAITQDPELHGPPAYFTWDEKIAAQSIQKLAALQPKTLAPGHGHPLAGEDVYARMEQFAQQFARENRSAA
ncbi:MAG TPA: MBL fold metallo-hydrolase [Acidobacteriaceae bacterium]|jgi:glyoxylase-like metal-dependent hydrolase (beta-lactamase superfamily II)|nr:MBL fold metallo-hydrolase [Acidobacteriaceae bacterium]